ncbi:O-antigen polymerase [Prochlorococcus marinus str. MU1402]|uniref:O-antigen ligase family protein n=1 Tax=Prochlorococcus marinus TaxID=1219 RepID=UPI001ADC6951|nr:O-antigen ligase family protein [Prochlorococcus marinus]MBO8232346.1 O-antigen ligase family protein [Prochlorococcus marinus XMU1402]MBW3057074.1 O-antigen polymerase [Prochlorococcus marinus str. MU1402]
MIVKKFKHINLRNKLTNNQPKKLGFKLFRIGILLLATAPSLSFLLLLFSTFGGLLSRENKFLEDKYSRLLILSSFLMIFNCFLITTDLIKTPESDKSLIWLGLLNWIPLFWCFWGFQNYLNTKNDRLVASKLLVIGSIPVLISGFCQKFLGLYGPYRFFNNLIIWYQRPLGADGGVSGLFNNQNYAGAWLCIIFPLCLGFLLQKHKKIFLNYINFSVVSSFVTMIILTTSRSAILAMLISYLNLEKFTRNKVLAIFISILSLILLGNILLLINIDIQKYITDYLPTGILNKIIYFKFSNLDTLPRFDIWSKSLTFINQNLFFGYGAGSFPNMYVLFDGNFEGMQHTHNIFLELAFNHGLLVALLILFTMVSILITASKNYFFNNSQDLSLIDKAWIISFANFIIIHMFDITYFDGRISILCWTLLAGLRKMKKNIPKI